MILGLMVVAAVGTTYLVASRNLSQQDAESRLQQSGAAAMAIVTQQIQKAGLVDMPSDWDGWQTVSPGMDRFDYLLRNSTAAAGFMPTSIHGCDNDYTTPNSLTTLTCKTGSGPAALTLAWQVRRTGGGSLPPVTTLPCLGSSSSLPSADVNSLTYVTAAGATLPVSTTWTTCRISLNAARDSIELTQEGSTDSVASNVVDLRFRYLVGPPGDSSHLSSYSSAADFAGGAISWSDVTGIEVCLLTRVAVPSNESKTYLPCTVDPITNAPVPVDVTDNFLYRAVRSIVVLRSRVQANPAAL